MGSGSQNFPMKEENQSDTFGAVRKSLQSLKVYQLNQVIIDAANLRTFPKGVTLAGPFQSVSFSADS